MSNTGNVGENPNDRMPDGSPLKPGEVVSDDDASSAGLEQEVEEDLDDMDELGDAEDPADDPDVIDDMDREPGLPR